MTKKEPRTIQEVISKLPRPEMRALRSPKYVEKRAEERKQARSYTSHIGLAVESMSSHMTDEGWQLFLGLRCGGYELHGKNIGMSITNCREIVKQFDPEVIVMQDKREWDGLTATKGSIVIPNEKFTGLEYLASASDIFKLTILKDAHQRPFYHANSAAEIGANGWVIYYHPDIVCHLAPYVRKEHTVRTWHTVDYKVIPSPVLCYHQRKPCCLAGAIGNVYPLRKKILGNLQQLGMVEYLPHPGYHRNGCCTPQFLQTLAGYRVAICTSSIYGYTLRKIIEATVSGCRVITDLPIDDPIPEIDGNLIRIHPDITVDDLRSVIRMSVNSYDPDIQKDYALRAVDRFDYRVEGIRLARAIEELRSRYNDEP